MERIGAVQACVDKIVAAQTKEIDIKFGYVHLYSVSQTCALLAMKRQQNVELAAIAGLLHDIYAYQTGNRKDHAHQGAAAARKILQELNLFSEEEIDMMVCCDILVCPEIALTSVDGFLGHQMGIGAPET